MLRGAEEFNHNAGVALDIASEYGFVLPDHDLGIQHMTIQCIYLLLLLSDSLDLCCYSLEQYISIIEVIRDIVWEPLSVTFSHVVRPMCSRISYCSTHS
jgi:hypothetical protein